MPKSRLMVPEKKSFYNAKIKVGSAGGGETSHVMFADIFLVNCFTSTLRKSFENGNRKSKR